MKKLIIVCLLAAFSAGCAEQKLTVNELPKQVIKSFGLAYPDAEAVRWAKEKQKGKTIYAAAFKTDGKKSEVEFDETGRFIKELYR